MSLAESLPYEPTVHQPIAQTDIFSSCPDAVFSISVPADEFGVTLPGLYTAARVFRANSYIEHNFIPETDRQDDGGESDADDNRSTHIVVSQNNGDGTVRVVGNMRSIVKRHENEPLPVEHYFPEAFKDSPAPVRSVEASRFIAEHDNKAIQGAISVSLMRTVTMNAFSQEREPIFAVVEDKLARRFAAVGLPFTPLSELKPLQAYGNTMNLALRFDPREILSVVADDIHEEKMITHFFKSARSNLGLGFYDATLRNNMRSQ